jgi:hypothetical protein
LIGVVDGVGFTKDGLENAVEVWFVVGLDERVGAGVFDGELNAGVVFANAVDDVDGDGDFGAGSLSLKSFIKGFVVALVPLVLSLSAFAAASFGLAAAH